MSMAAMPWKLSCGLVLAADNSDKVQRDCMKRENGNPFPNYFLKMLTSVAAMPWKLSCGFVLAADNYDGGITWRERMDFQWYEENDEFKEEP